MHLSEFTEAFKMIRDKWPRYYTQDMESDLFLLLEPIEAKRVKRFFKSLRWRREAPDLETFQHFARHNSGQSAKDLTTEELRQNYCRCQKCLDCGVVHTRDLQGPLFHDGLGESMFFRCDCAAGQKEKETITQWTSSWAIRYKIHSIADPDSRKKHRIKYMTIDGKWPYPPNQLDLDKIMRRENAG